MANNEAWVLHDHLFGSLLLRFSVSFTLLKSVELIKTVFEVLLVVVTQTRVPVETELLLFVVEPIDFTLLLRYLIGNEDLLLLQELEYTVLLLLLEVLG